MSNNRRVVNGVNTVVLHGKDYVEVVERLRIVYELKKELEIVESQPYQFADRWVWRVTAKVDGKQYIGNAEVKLSNAMKGSPDATNPFECAETSALGRALAFAGLGTVESIASYDEIARGQPLTTIVEAGHRQLPITTPLNGQEHASTSNHTSNPGKAVSQPVQSQPAPSGNTSRLNMLYTKAQEAGQIEKGLGKQEGAAAFLKWASEVLGANVVNVGQLTTTRIETLEAFLSTKDAA